MTMNGKSVVMWLTEAQILDACRKAGLRLKGERLLGVEWVQTVYDQGQIKLKLQVKVDSREGEVMTMDKLRCGCDSWEQCQIVQCGKHGSCHNEAMMTPDFSDLVLEMEIIDEVRKS